MIELTCAKLLACLSELREEALDPYPAAKNHLRSPATTINVLPTVN